ncbi:Protein kinase, ATP binding site domain-containing protein [Rozella allomycis CSF55]|uniref:non-specific serine/threonine protein kinase n=1 Tax=Rozella allomycis (strain CSF55) TaxID=988480 RepID=A0A075AZ24_ROZAC|nr:Protein kinase, ATP binding site domain-containing protein [Rozella allomycis CSF55]|eukprot:EPZ33962.1 Protein kinase, ATP binding site domain-containing protein [Rozella allomycis CSF55]
MSAIPRCVDGEFEVLEKLGHGSFGTVEKVRRLSDGKIFALKSTQNPYMSPLLLKWSYYSEIRGLDRLKFSSMFPKLICIFNEQDLTNIATLPTAYRFVMEYLPGQLLQSQYTKCLGENIGANFYDHLQECKKHLPDEEEMKSVIAQCLLALEDAEFAGLSLTDVKPENMMYNQGRITFFDLNGALHKSDLSLVKFMTPIRGPPEVLKTPIKIDHTKNALYSVGTILGSYYGIRSIKVDKMAHNDFHNVIYPLKVFPITMNMFELDNNLKGYEDFKKMTGSDVISDFISRLVTLEPEGRMSISETKKHQYFEGFDWDALIKRIGYVKPVNVKLEAKLWKNAPTLTTKAEALELLKSFESESGEKVLTKKQVRNE